ncbi:MAG TPA: SIR2 family protein [Acetobacteraceae bacterium]|jgi:hypothetical protein
MTHSDTVRELASILSPQNEARPTVLLGAGASFSSGVPLADESVKRIARRYYAERVDGKALPEQVKTSEWLAWLADQPWFIRDPGRLSENFPLAVKHLLTPQAYRQRVLLDLIAPDGEIGLGYRHLSELVLRGLIGTILTTNFDICLPRALNDKRPHLRHVAEVNRGPDDFREFDIFNRAQIVWLHGKAEQYTDKNLTEEVQQLDAKLVGILLPLLQSTPLIVVGYRGAEPSIMKSLLGEGGDLAFKKGVFWCHVGGDLHPNVEALRQRLGSNFKLCDIDGFDELFADLDKKLVRQQRTLGAPPAVGRLDFDDRPMEDATVADLDLDLALHTAHAYSKKLGLREPSAATLKAFLRELGLLVYDGGVERPSIAAVLLFGREPQRFPLLRHAVVTATINAKKRKVISGNLLQQRNDLLEWAEQKDVNPTLKVKVRDRHEERRAYPERALVELCVNLLVHRDYADVRAATIEAQTNNGIIFLNPGRLPEGVADELQMDARGQFDPVREFTSPRNRALCDVFFGMRLMERAGTGLSDVLSLAREGDGTAVFSVPPGSEDFRAEIYQPRASGKSSLVARDTRPIGTYIVNLMPFASLPALVSRTAVSGTLEAISRQVPLNEIGTALVRGGELWSFAPAALLHVVLEPVMMEATVRETPRGEIEADPDLARVLSWLLRKHFEGQLRRLHNRGLMIETDRRTDRRAYFFGERGPLLLIYDTPARRGVEREVVKQRGERPRVWFENEGITYDIARLGSLWGVRVKPFYMFTGPDAQTPLPGYARTAKAARRMKYDRNQSVESDFTFWARFISQGSPVVNLGQGPVEDLLLEGAFISFDVPEEGLIDGDGDKDQMSA